MSPVLQDLVSAQERVQRILWMALVCSILLYGVVVHMVAAQGAAPETLPPLLPVALSVVSLGLGAVSMLWPRFVLSDAKVRAALGRPPGAQYAPQLLARMQELGASERRLLAVLPLGFTTLIVRLALNEAIAIYGLVLALISHDPTWFWVFAVPALILDFAMFPKLEPLIDRARTLAVSPALPE